MSSRQNSNIVGACEAQRHLSELLEKVETGEEIVITKHGSPIARLVPVRREASAQERLAAVRRIQKLSSGLSLGRLKVKDLIREGRKGTRCSDKHLRKTAKKLGIGLLG